ncbi:MAG: T9SS type A sorting domain-containing protein [Flavobacteriales bacterium]|nr:T9SS type A sorting domain-containing protein [Flavobacteriales bacterium]
MKKLILLFLFLSFGVKSQEVISPLISNSDLQKNTRSIYDNKSSLSIPFIDDFSNNSSYPDSNLWKDNSVFINRNYGVNPITIGVATFDGLNLNGRAYNMTSTSTDSENADTLTSQQIDLSNIDTSYFMFYYQAQGNGNDPQITDSLILEFYSGTDSLGDAIWNTVWEKEGSTFHQFKKVVYIFTDPEYLTLDFSFRFRNLASVTGNFDHWNIDYVKLDEYHNSSDTSFLNDVAFVRNTPQILKRYREMPWIHFVNDMTQEMNDSLDIILRNNTDIIQSIDYRYDVYNENGNLTYHYPVLGGNNSTRNVDVPPYYYIDTGTYAFNSPPIMIDDQIFPVSSADSAEFIFRNSINTEPSDFKNNDTVFHLQRFYSHFAYDDGSAESAYGINVQGAKLAYKFNLNRPDTLRIVQMKFVEMHEDLTSNKFALTIWDNNNGDPGQEVYKDTVEIEYKDRGKFTNYYLKNGVGLIGTFFVGWEQITNDILNLGLDKNSVANDYMLYNIGGGWVNSQFPGAWMIRPVVNFDTPLISYLSEKIVIDCKIYPNPFSDKTSIYFNNNSQRTFKLFDMIGRTVRSFSSSDNKIDIYKENLRKGIYFIQITEGNVMQTKKLILN